MTHNLPFIISEAREIAKDILKKNKFEIEKIMGNISGSTNISADVSTNLSGIKVRNFSESKFGKMKKNGAGKSFFFAGGIFLPQDSAFFRQEAKSSLRKELFFAGKHFPAAGKHFFSSGSSVAAFPFWR